MPKTIISFLVCNIVFDPLLKAHLVEFELHNAVANETNAHCYLVSWNLWRNLVYCLLF